MSHRIELSWDDVLRQAKMTAGDYMEAAYREVREMFGEEYARSPPELMIAYMKAASNDYFATAFSVGAQKIADALTIRREEHE